MRHHLLIPALALAVLGLTAAGAAVASSSEGFDELMRSYEAIRLELLADSTEGVAEEAEAIADGAEHIAEKAITPGGRTPEGRTPDGRTPDGVKAILPELAAAARDLAAATDLSAAREAFNELSRVMVRYRAEVEGERPVVVYCPMAAKSWLQPDAENIGNPYYGSSMASCGAVVEG